MGRARAQRGASADDVALAAGNHPLHADDAVPCAAQGPADVGAGTGARAHPGARRARRAHRRAAGEPAGRVVDRRWPRQRRHAGRGGEGAGGRPLMDVIVNIPEVVAEVRALFERYEQALVDKNVEVLDATFWDSPHTIRYSLPEPRLEGRQRPRLDDERAAFALIDLRIVRDLPVAAYRPPVTARV